MNRFTTTNAAQTSRPPILVIWLGYGGLLPFIALATQCAIDTNLGLLWRSILLGYGAVILSFVGALHWAFAMTLPDLTHAKRSECYAWGVVPALIGWVAASIPISLLWQWPSRSTAFETTLMVAAFLAHYFQDRRLVKVAQLPAWYLPLRLQLTLVASVCLLVGGFAAVVVPR
jgi:hypothetical protein